MTSIILKTTRLSILACLFTLCALPTLKAQKADTTVTLTYKPKYASTTNVVALVSYNYDSTYGWFDYKRLSQKDSFFTIQLALNSNVLDIIVSYFEYPKKWVVQENSVEHSSGVTMIHSLRPDFTERKIFLVGARLASRKILLDCTEKDIAAFANHSGTYTAVGVSNLFFCLLRRFSEYKSFDSTTYYFERYGKAALLELQAKPKTDLEYLAAVAVLYIAAGDKVQGLKYLKLLAGLYPNSTQFYLLSSYYNEIWGGYHIDFHEYMAKYPYSAFADLASSTPYVQAHTISYEAALSTHHHFSNYYKYPYWHEYIKLTNLIHAYGKIDSAAARKKEIIKAFERGDICINATVIDSANFFEHYWDVAQHCFSKQRYTETMTFIRPVFELYHANYKKLSFLGNNITIHGNILAQSLVQTNQPDSALKVYTELVKLTQLDSLFEKIEGTYISIHGSKEGYQDYLVQNGIDKFIVETKHAPEALFKLYGSDKEVSLSSLKGKVVVLNFWGTYCVPCIKEMPELNDLKKRFSYSSDVVFLAPTRDNAAKLAGFFKEKQFDYQISYEADSIFETYKAYFVPVNMVINRQGEIVFEEAGAYKDTLLKLSNAIEEAL